MFDCNWANFPAAGPKGADKHHQSVEAVQGRYQPRMKHSWATRICVPGNLIDGSHVGTTNRALRWPERALVFSLQAVQAFEACFLMHAWNCQAIGHALHADGTISLSANGAAFS